MNMKGGRISHWTCLALFAVLVVMRIRSLTPNELSWDVFGYYLYLPATFIHHDPLLHDTAWIHGVMGTHGISGTLYQLSTAPDNATPMYFFLMGMAVCYAPFFFIGHLFAALTGAPMDGFSAPYQVSIAVGCMAYAGIALVHVRKLLLHFFSDGATAATLAVLVLGTNYLQFATAKDLETANFLFCWMSVLVWNTLRWHEGQRPANMMWIAASIALITLIKPSEVLCGIIPLLWGVHDRASLQAKGQMLAAHWKQVALALALGLCILAPQLLYWRTMTGSFIYDSYKNPGVGLDVMRPHIAKVLFSFRKGWLVYTPVMLFALAGLVTLWRRQRPLFLVVVVHCAVAFYVIASWSEWWYGASYSVRPMITLHVLLSLPLAWSFTSIANARLPVRIAGTSVVLALVALNMFQLWQFRNWVIHPYLTTRDYYFAVFGRTKVPPGAGDLLSMDRSFDGSDRMADADHYDILHWTPMSFDDSTAYGTQAKYDTAAHSRVLILDGDHPYSPDLRRAYEAITGKELCWVKARARVFLPQDYAEETPCLVMTMTRKEGTYGYRTACMVADSTTRGRWTTLEGLYMTPPIRDPRDELQVYIWQRGKAPVAIDDLEVDAYIPH